MRFALLEIKLTLVRLLKKYKLERTEKTAPVSLDTRNSDLHYIIVSGELRGVESMKGTAITLTPDDHFTFTEHLELY